MPLRILLAFLLLCGVPGARAIQLLAPPAVESSPSGDTVLRWRLDAPAGGKVRYGTAQDRLDQTASDGVGAEHSVALRGLLPGTRYFFSVGTARTVLTTGSFVAGRSGVDTTPAAPPSPASAEKSSVLAKIGRAITAPFSPTQPPAPASAPPTRVTWANPASLQDHFERHGADFGSKSPDDYAAGAWRFRERAVAEKLPMKLDSDGTVRVFDPKTRAFAAYHSDGTAKTWFRPESPTYWQRQPGRAIQTPPWISQ